MVDSHEFLTTIDDDHSELVITAHDKGVAFGITVLAGFAAFIGAFSIFCIKKYQLKYIIPIALGFSAGVLIHLSFIGLASHSVENFTAALSESEEEHEEHAHRRRRFAEELEEEEEAHEEEAGSIEAQSHFYTLLCIALGIILMILSEKLSEKYGCHAHGHEHGHEHKNKDNSDNQNENEQNGNEDGDTSGKDQDGNTSGKGQDEEDQDKEQSVTNSANGDTNSTNNLKKVSYNIALALVLHHFPEGIATYVALVYDFEFGILVALALALHDIPSGISIATTVYCATKSYCRVFTLCFIAAMAYPLGAVFGVIIVEADGDSELLNAILFGIVCGIMLYVCLIEIIPAMITQINTLQSTQIAKYSFIALFLGLLFMEISVIVLAATDFHSH